MASTCALQTVNLSSADNKYELALEAMLDSVSVCVCECE